MNIEKANAIPLTEILAQLKIEPVKENAKEAWYLSPLRYELTASFHVNKDQNIWFDFGLFEGGNAFNFVRALLRSKGDDFSPKYALQCIREMHLTPGNFNREALITEKGPLWIVEDIEPITEPALYRYLENRGIPFAIGKDIFQQVIVRHRHLDLGIAALGMQNEDEGYELRNRNFKGCAGAKTLSFIRGTDPSHSKLHIFEGAMDYATFVTTRENHGHEGDAIILHSTGCAAHVPGHIKGLNYKEAFTWLDNDRGGELATGALIKLFKSEGINYRVMNSVYEGHNDLNAWHMHNLNLVL
ncbi:MAG TPA: toprim domain-containing protein [Mucilaginibacter sp.]|nr:toprim domain-containing protein [Mucilaginibacter sp.]